jgi:hypothetical protein
MPQAPLWHEEPHVRSKIVRGVCQRLKLEFGKPLKAIVLEVGNSNGIGNSFAGRMVKLVVNNHPVLPLKSQQHPGDSQYVRQQDGFFCFPLKDFPFRNHFDLKLVFYKMEFRNMLFRIFLIPKGRN